MPSKPRGPGLAPGLAQPSERRARHCQFSPDFSRRLHSYPETKRLTQVPGIGPITSLAFVLSIEDPHRFQDVRDVGAWLGMVPRKDQSGGRDPHLRITKAGNSFLRRLLVNCAQYIAGPFGPDSNLRRFAERLGPRGTPRRKKAIVAVARKLSVLLLTLWRTGAEYQPLRGVAA